MRDKDTVSAKFDVNGFIFASFGFGVECEETEETEETETEETVELRSLAFDVMTELIEQH
ncbi:MAG: hypothetical protein ACO22U_17115 [bacterium]